MVKSTCGKVVSLWMTIAVVISGQHRDQYFCTETELVFLRIAESAVEGKVISMPEGLDRPISEELAMLRCGPGPGRFSQDETARAAIGFFIGVHAAIEAFLSNSNDFQTECERKQRSIENS